MAPASLNHPSFGALSSPCYLRRHHYSSASLRKPRPTVEAQACFDDMHRQEAVEESAQQRISLLPKYARHDEAEYHQNLAVSPTLSAGKCGVKLHSVMPLPLLAIAALPGAGTVSTLFEPIAEAVRRMNLPDWLVHWGHPGNMAVVLFAMGGYGSYLGWQIRLSDDMEVKVKAKDLHPKLLGGMFFFFSLGATGGILSLLTSGKPIFESPHAVTGLSGLALLTIQTALTGLFESNPSLRSVHGILGSGIMLLFFVHAVFGLQLGLSY